MIRWVVAALAVGLVWLVWPDASCAPFRQPGSEVWLALGQSNAGNHGERRYTGSAGVFTFDGQRCVPAQDPMPGTSGAGGSVWVALANRWVAEGRARQVLVVTRAQESTGIAQWQPGGALFGRIVATSGALRLRGVKISRIFWSHGETDAALGTPESAYSNGLSSLIVGIRRAGIDAPIHVALASVCGPAASPAIRRAQFAAVGGMGVLAGPDLDRIGAGDRHERCHFSGTGQELAAKAWDSAVARGLPR